MKLVRLTWVKSNHKGIRPLPFDKLCEHLCVGKTESGRNSSIKQNIYYELQDLLRSICINVSVQQMPSKQRLLIFFRGTSVLWLLPVPLLHLYSPWFLHPKAPVVTRINREVIVHLLS